MTILIYISYTLVSIAILLGIYRMILGPTAVDRIIAFDTIAICAVAFTVLLSMQWRTGFFLELILIFSALGFFTTVAFVFYLQRRLETDADEETSNQLPTNSGE